MKIDSAPRSAAITSRALAIGLCFASAFLALLSFAANPATGTLTDTSPPVQWTGGPFVVANATGNVGDPVCSVPMSCDDFKLTVQVTTDANKRVKINVAWPVSAADFDVYVYDSQGKTIVTSCATSSDPEVCYVPAAPATYIVRVVPFAPAGQSYTATATLESSAPAPVGGSGVAPRYQNYPPNPANLPGADSAGEPSIGVDWNPNVASLKNLTPPQKLNTGGVAFFTANLNEYRVNFDDCSSPAKNIWEDVTSPTEGVASLDPIGFVDHQAPGEDGAGLGRIFQSELAGASSIMAYSDTDGNSWTQSQGSGQPAGVDHQTVGGGPYNANALPPPPPHPLYKHQIYYASQDIATAFAARSDNGGQTFGPGVAIWTIADCGGLHGHIKVGPDGTVYVPNRGCGGAQAVSVSEDNGLTWTVRKVPGSTPGGTDPSVGIAADNTVYFGYQNGDGRPHIAVSKDHGKTWKDVDVSQGFIKNIVFPEVVAGDGNRAAFGFLGTSTEGNYQDTANFAGVWYFYIATTLDGGQTYTLVDATNGDPVQLGSICTGGTTCGGDRNLLDFNDLQIDKEGRVLAAYADGCVAPACDSTKAAAHKPPYNESRSALASILRQSGGPRLLAAFDPPLQAVPGAPRVNSVVRGADGIVHLSWSTPDNGGSPLTGYNVYRKTGDTGSYSLSGTVSVGCPNCKTTFDDATATDPAAKYIYKVTALNAIGEGPSCGEFAVAAAAPVQSACLLPGITILTDQAGDIITPIGQTSNPGWDLRSLSIAEPIAFASPDKLIFTLKVESFAGGLPPANTRWPIQFLVNGDQTTGYFVDMSTYPTDGGSPAAPVFKYGTFSPTGGTSGAYGAPNTRVGNADAQSGFNPNGTITIVLSRSKIAPLAVGSTMSGFLVRVRFGSDAAAVTPDNMPDSLAPSGNYTVKGNLACAANTAPVAALTATPRVGDAPLTVNFDASASTDADAGDTIASYTFDFGDGSAQVTQSTPTIQHTYNSRGVYRATVSVTDSRGLVSGNVAQVEVEIAAALLNISTRENVQTGDNVLIGGFIINGSNPRKLVLRAIGPSVKNVPGTLQDPTLELHDAGGKVIDFNDNWKDKQQAEIEATGIAPTDDRESAIVTTLAPGNYTAIVRGKGDTTGIGLVEVYDIDPSVTSKLANISTRGFVQTGDNVMIGGFIAGPFTAAATRIVVRAIGPSLKPAVTNTLDDPTLELYDRNGNQFASNDNWKDSQEAAIQATGLAPTDSRESAIYVDNLIAGNYTAIVRGKSGTVGVGLVEVYNLPHQ